MEKVTCPKCGKENPANYKYCFECGYEMPKQLTPVMEETPPEKVKSKGRLIFGVMFGIAFIIAFYAAQHFFFGSASVDKNLMKVASELNQSCPVMVDSETRLDNTVASPNKTFQYYYTLVNIEKNDVDPSEAKKTLEPHITNIVKTSPDMKAMRDLDVTFKYNYRDKNGVFIFDIIIGPDKYR